MSHTLHTLFQIPFYSVLLSPYDTHHEEMIPNLHLLKIAFKIPTFQYLNIIVKHIPRRHEIRNTKYSKYFKYISYILVLITSPIPDAYYIARNAGITRNII